MSLVYNLPKKFNLSRELKTLFNGLGNVRYGSFVEVAKDLTQEGVIDQLKDLIYPAILAFRDIDFEYNDPRFKYKFDLKLLILTETDQNITTEESQEGNFEEILYPILDSIVNRIESSPVIICDHFLTYKHKEMYNVNKLGIQCDCLEVEIQNLKFIK